MRTVPFKIVKALQKTFHYLTKSETLLEREVLLDEIIFTNSYEDNSEHVKSKELIEAIKNKDKQQILKILS